VRAMDRSAYQRAASAVHHDERSGASGAARRLKLGFQVPTDLCVARQTLFQGGEGFSRFLSQSVAVSVELRNHVLGSLSQLGEPGTNLGLLRRRQAAQLASRALRK
jgi:hypothetical protein